jgi:hypothetical protein
MVAHPFSILTRFVTLADCVCFAFDEDAHPFVCVWIALDGRWCHVVFYLK